VSDSRASTLVVGASGLVGRRLLEHYGGDALGTHRRTKLAGGIELDITDAAAVARLFERLLPKVVIQTAALTDVDRCEREPEASHAINVAGTANVAAAAAAVGARMLFFSTDYVFGGERGPHRADEPVAPLNVYGRHKLEAERIVARRVTNHVIVRACNLYGYQPYGKNFVLTVFEATRAGRPIRVPSDQWGSPTLAEDLAAATRSIAESDLTGVVHLAGPDYLDRLSLARRAARAFGLDVAGITGVPTAELGQSAPRPLKGGLEASPSVVRLGVTLRDLDAGLALMSGQLRAAGLLR
jgi:dTDP-4-dehydrorhamnose reductase